MMYDPVLDGFGVIRTEEQPHHTQYETIHLSMLGHQSCCWVWMSYLDSWTAIGSFCQPPKHFLRDPTIDETVGLCLEVKEIQLIQNSKCSMTVAIVTHKIED